MKNLCNLTDPLVNLSAHRPDETQRGARDKRSSVSEIRSRLWHVTDIRKD